MSAALLVETPLVQTVEFLSLYVSSRHPVLAKACMCCGQLSTLTCFQAAVVR